MGPVRRFGEGAGGVEGPPGFADRCWGLTQACEASAAAGLHINNTNAVLRGPLATATAPPLVAPAPGPIVLTNWSAGLMAQLGPLANHRLTPHTPSPAQTAQGSGAVEFGETGRGGVGRRSLDGM